MQEKDPFVFNKEDGKEAGGLNARAKPQPGPLPAAFENPAVLQKLEIELNFSVGGESVLLEGSVKADLQLECSRCGEPLARTFEDAFDEVYPDTVEYIDTREVIRETAGLLAPIKVLCADDCKGRCLVCGVNRNKGACGHTQERTASFEALKDFKPGTPGEKKKL